MTKRLLRQFPPLPPGKSTTPPATPSEKFVRAAPGKNQYPWEDPNVREDMMQQLNVKQPEKVMVMMDWFAWQLKMSKRAFVEDALRAHVARYMAEFGIDEKN